MKGTGKKKDHQSNPANASDANTLKTSLLGTDDQQPTAKQKRSKKPTTTNDTTATLTRASRVETKAKTRDKTQKHDKTTPPAGYKDLGPQSDTLYQASLANQALIDSYGAPTTHTMNRGGVIATAPIIETPKAQVIDRGVNLKAKDVITSTPLHSPVINTDDAPVETEAQRKAREKREREQKKESCCDICCDSCCFGSSSNSSNNVYIIYAGSGPTQNQQATNNDTCCLSLCCPPRPVTCCPTFSNDNTGTSCCFLPCNMVSHLLHGVGNLLCGESGLLNGGCLKNCCPERPTCFNCDMSCGNPLDNVSCGNPCDRLGQGIEASGDWCNLIGGCISGCCEGLSKIECGDCPCPN